MSQEERSNTRDLVYSAWHRTKSLSRFIDTETAMKTAMIDIDGVEYDPLTKKPVALIETAIYGKHHKAATVTRNLAIMAGIPAYVVRYVDADTPNPANVKWPDITEFHVRRIAPDYSETRIMTPTDFAEFLVSLRTRAQRIKAVS